MKGMPILSFFTGGGFLDLGFHMNNFEVVWTNEFNKEFSKVYKNGMSSCLGKRTEISAIESIQNFDYKDLIKLSGLKNFKNRLWGIIGGPPCPDFSVGGKHAGKDGNRGSLTNTYIDIICNLKPSFFVFENVKGLISVEKHKLFFNEIVERLKTAGYAVDYKLLNALELGVPQDRERVIMIGINDAIYKRIITKEYNGEQNWFFWPYYEKYNNAKSKYNWPQTTPFGSVPQCPDNIPLELTAGYYILNQNELEILPNSNEFFTPKSQKFNCIEEGDDRKKSFKRLHRWRYSPTVAYGNNEVHLHPSLPQRLSVREALRLQTVPDSYVIDNSISLSSKYKVIGNGVPVKMAYNIASSLKRFLDNYIWYYG